MNLLTLTRYVRVPGLLIPLLGVSLTANEETPAAPVVAGLDVSIDGAVGLHGTGEGEGSLHGNALGHVLWQQQPTTAEGRGVAWSAYASALWIQGRGPTAEFLNDSLAASNSEGFETVRLYSWWLEGNAGSWSARAGALLADEEFAGTESGGNLMNSAFGWPAYISANTVNTGPAFYAAALGLRIAWESESGTSWKLGVYDGDSFDSRDGDDGPNRHGLHYSMSEEQGVFVISEGAFCPSAGWPTVKLGAWWHSAAFDDGYLDQHGGSAILSGLPALQHSSNYGAYAILEHTLLGEADKPGHVCSHLRAGMSPEDRNAVSWSVDTALAWTGPLPSRPADVLAVGVAHVATSQDFVRSLAAASPAAHRNPTRRSHLADAKQHLPAHGAGPMV